MLVLILLFFTCQVSAEVRGVTGTEIVVGQWGPQTGIASNWGNVGVGSGIFFNFINDGGGIHGRKIKYIFRDDSFQPSKTKAVTKELVEQTGIFALIGGIGTATAMSVKSYLAENKVPWVSPVNGSSALLNGNNKYIFATLPLNSDDAFSLAKWVYEKQGLKKIGIIYQNDDWGRECLNIIQRQYQVTALPIELTDRDLSTYAVKFQHSKSDAILLLVTVGQAVLLIKESARIGYNPQWAGGYNFSDTPLLMELTNGQWAGAIHSNFVEYDKGKKYLNGKWNSHYCVGIYCAEIFVEGLRRVGRDLNTESFVKAMETIKDFKGIGSPITFTDKDRQGGKYIFLSKVKNDGSEEKLTDWVRITN